MVLGRDAYGSWGCFEPLESGVCFVASGVVTGPGHLTFGGGLNSQPVWSPDARYIVFQAMGGMSWTRADGGDKPQALTQSKNIQSPWSFTPDGKRLAFQEVIGSGDVLWTIPLESDGAGLRAGKPEVSEAVRFAPA